MPTSCFLQNAPYKGLFLLILLFVALEYFFSTVSDANYSLFNSANNNNNNNKAKSSTSSNKKFELDDELQTISIKNLFQLNIGNNNNLSNISNLQYLVTIPPFFLRLANHDDINFTAPSSSSSSSMMPKFHLNNNKNLLLNPCPDISQYLYGKVKIEKYAVPLVHTLESRFTWLKPGGQWKPLNCTVAKKVAIVIPYRNRAEHLLLFLQHMHPFLKKQQLDYRIFVVEQDGTDGGPFNRAMLMNIGYVEALKLNQFDCFIFHDVDLLPEDERNLYTCPEQPRHMSVAVDLFKYRLPYPAIFGGVSAISTAHFQLLNGFSNSFWGWGGEDDDMSNRIRHHHLYISRYPVTIARYTMLSHQKDLPNPSRYEVLKKGKKIFDKDGLSDLSYELLTKNENNLLYTWFLVNLHRPTNNTANNNNVR